MATIASVLDQDQRDKVEIVVKCASHHLEDVLRSFADIAGGGQVQLVFGNDTGIYDAFNICVGAARGMYVMFLGCGDTLAHRGVLRTVVDQSAQDATCDVLYGGVVLDTGTGRVAREFDNRCYFGERTRFPWRNLCHHQGLIYRRDWLTLRPFRTDIGPLADSVHNYQHRIFEIAKWLGQPVSVFRDGGASTQTSLRASARRMNTVLVNCEFFRPPLAWKALSVAVLGARYLLNRATSFREPPEKMNPARNATERS